MTIPLTIALVLGICLYAWGIPLLGKARYRRDVRAYKDYLRTRGLKVLDGEGYSPPYPIVPLTPTEREEDTL